MNSFLRLLFGVVLSGFLIIGLLACSGSDSAKLRYGGQYYPGEFLLEGHDFFGEQEIAVEHTIFSSGTENNEALISGNIDVNVGSDSKSVALFGALGEKVVIIGTVQRGNRYSTMIRADSKYTNWKDLKGKTVGTRFGSGAEYVLRKYFESQQDFSWNDYEWINLKTEDMIAALKSGQIEAFTVWAPTGEIAESQGIAKPLKSYGDVAQTPVSIHTTIDYLEKNRDKLVKFLRAHLTKADMIRNNPQKAAELAASAAEKRGLKVSADAFALIFERINFQIDFAPEAMRKELTATAEFLVSQGKIDEVPGFRFDHSVIEDAMED
ncbi:MAG: NrtA/SsuA/CpmA family ABC transporter substrate-binding protein [Spirochaetales bacterium]|nr:NrtA/SsuA/CpmA family ABC transporter substrate-binding protein [Spirochaetales bacterium]MCF7937752.1 NrtA/SsuA/CpmA family ABC transporter substrate-binding protein [Spirochaetales bacterium]